MSKYIKKKDLKEAIDICTWYHITKTGKLAEGATLDDEPLYKYSDIKKIIKELPTTKFTKVEESSYERGKADAWQTAQTVFGSTLTLYEAEDVARQIEVAKDIKRRVDIGQRLETMSCQECKYWKYIAKEWKCSVVECQYEPKGESDGCR